MSKKSRPEIYNERIKEYIENLEDNNDYTYEYIGKDKDGLYLYDYIPNYNKERNVFEILNERYYSYISNSIYNKDVEDDILNLFKDGEIILIEEGIKRIEGLINEETPVDKLFRLLSEVQGIEIKPYNRFDIRDVDGYFGCGPYYLDENFFLHNCFDDITTNSEQLTKILIGTATILKCKKAVVLTEEDIICLKYYQKNGYKYITNNKYYNGETNYYKTTVFIEKPELISVKDINSWHYINNKDIFYTKDELSFIHYDYPEIWDIDELLEQERVSND